MSLHPNLHCLCTVAASTPLIPSRPLARQIALAVVNPGLEQFSPLVLLPLKLRERVPHLLMGIALQQ